MGNRLSIIMKSFDISGKDLASILFVDESLVSKWRSGKRMLHPNSAYVDKIIETVITLDQPNKFINICKLLADDYDNIFSCSAEELALHFRAWLTTVQSDDDSQGQFDPLKSDKHVDLLTYYYFKGNSGRRKAIKFMNEYALAQSKSVNIISFSDEEASWFYEDESFLSAWSQRLQGILRKGHTQTVFHPVNRSYEDMATSIIRWLPHHMTGQTTAYYIPEYTGDLINHTYYMIEDHLALVGSSPKKSKKGVNTCLTNDQNMLHNINEILQAYISSALKMFNRYHCKPTSGYYEQLLKIYSMRTVKYIHSSVWLYLPKSEQLFFEIMQNNNIAANEAQVHWEKYKKLSLYSISTPCRYIINLDTFKEICRASMVEMVALSYLTGQRIVVSNQLFKQVMHEMLSEMKKSPSIESGILDANQKDEFESFNVIAQKNTCVHFMGMQAEPGRSFILELHELSSVIAVYDHFEHIWNAIPARKRDKDYIVARMEETLTQ